MKIRDFDINKVCSLESFLIWSDTKKRKLSRLLSKVKYLFFYEPDIGTIKKVQYFFFISMHREDYNILFDTIF